MQWISTSCRQSQHMATNYQQQLYCRCCNPHVLAYRGSLLNHQTWDCIIYVTFLAIAVDVQHAAPIWDVLAIIAVFWPSQPVGPIVSMKSPTFQRDKSCGNFRPLLFENLLLPIPNQGLKDGAAGMQRAFGTNTDFRTLGAWVLTWHGGIVSMYIYIYTQYWSDAPTKLWSFWGTSFRVNRLRSYWSYCIFHRFVCKVIILWGTGTWRDQLQLEISDGTDAAMCIADLGTQNPVKHQYTQIVYIYIIYHYMMCVYNIHTLRTICYQREYNS